ncbi:MAG: YabP family [Haloplasmataceae bacterium]|nr:YabP family [Haloplasmataceae bacterium]
MKNMGKIFSNIKHYNDQLFENVEKITIVDREKVYIQNYNEIIEIKENEIRLSRLVIKGKNLKIVGISKYFLEVNGNISDVFLGAIKDE